MLAAALLLVAAAVVSLVVGAATGPLAVVHASIWLALLGALLLAVGVARCRPRRHARPAAPTWSGAAGPADQDPARDAFDHRGAAGRSEGAAGRSEGHRDDGRPPPPQWDDPRADADDRSL